MDSVSVIVATYQQPDLLQRCLLALSLVAEDDRVRPSLASNAA
jgi:hypothetical protein